MGMLQSNKGESVECAVGMEREITVSSRGGSVDQSSDSGYSHLCYGML